ncbi:MAG: ATP-binding protein, partial [Candidatus Peribacteraceae bacterium]|nr:ATP-binding protein [Candidatus Peribacteraceae bacterium]
MQEKVSIVPSPRILIAIAQNPIQPVQALAELIDNGVDAYSIAKREGISVEKQTISISIPTKKDIEDGKGELVIEDRGPGMTLEQATNAITAGYSDKANPDLLGLFGMGFNIATAKIGQITTLSTARKEDKKMTNLTIDLKKMTQAKEFFADVSESKKPYADFSGTIVRITGWWSQGSQNYGFVKKLANLSKKDLRDKIGRIYYPIINEGTEILVDGEKCNPYRHCVWSDSRYVTTKEGKVSAQMSFDQIISIEYKCSNPECKEVALSKADKCPSCKSKLIPFEHRLHGWIGIQRFDDLNSYGIDLIRNGRVIRPFEQDGFFKFVDDQGNERKEYPADSVYGRIVGEVHVDYIPVNYLKTDFERSTAEWAEMVKFIRGETSLWPDHESNRDTTNKSPLFRLFQGYRRVRIFGTKHMYMGRWNAGEETSRRLTREEEQELYKKFLDGEQGYRDDTKWWELV